MAAIHLSNPVKDLYGVGPAAEEKLAKQRPGLLLDGVQLIDPVQQVCSRQYGGCEQSEYEHKNLRNEFMLLYHVPGRFPISNRFLFFYFVKPKGFLIRSFCQKVMALR